MGVKVRDAVGDEGSGVWDVPCPAGKGFKKGYKNK